MAAISFLAVILATQAPFTAPYSNSRPLPPPPATVEPARPRSPIGAYFSDADYPAEAIHSGEQGLVGFRLTVGPDGRVARCTITSSSGSAALDAATCRILTSRARFIPAHDMQGNPTLDSVNSRINWVLPPEPEPENGEQPPAPKPSTQAAALLEPR